MPSGAKKARIRTFAFAGLVGILASSDGWAARPYRPAHPDPVMEAWRRHTFPELNRQGLRSLVEGKNGHMWFGMDEGVRIYDGLDWGMFTPEDGIWGTPVHLLCATEDSSIYAGTDLRISRYHKGAWSRVFPSKGDLHWPVSDLMEATDGSLWAATMWGALHLEGKVATLYTSRWIGDAVQTIVPYVQISPVSDEVAHETNWVSRIGVLAAPAGAPGAGGEGAFTSSLYRLFLSFPSGSHTLDVRARDRDFNLDPTPASFQFKVVP